LLSRHPRIGWEANEQVAEIGEASGLA